MRRAWVVLWSVVAATAIVAFSFATADDLLGGAGAAARNSARFSAFLFAVALAARAGRPPQLADHQIELTLGFVAAHAIHYGTVLARAAIDPANALRQPSLDALVVVAGGVGLLALVGLTARAHSTSAPRAHAIAFYIVGAIFAAALAPHVRAHAIPSAIVLATLIAAFLWRIGNAFARRQARGA